MNPYQLYEENQGLAAYTLNKKFPLSVNEDTLQVARIGLWKACLSFEPEKGFQFSTYASTCIFNEIAMYFRSENKYTRLGVINFEDLSPVDSDFNESFLDSCFEDERAQDFIEELEEQDIREQVLDRLDLILTEKEKYIIHELYVKGRGQVPLSKELGISQSYLSRLYRKVLIKIYNIYKDCVSA